ncbi:MAG: hypothetical protein JWQ09_5505 [Segetibacter sp.]|nr:hypothetical protein [Segetibacter sp.]
MQENEKELIAILTDSSAEVDEKDDAALYLSQYNTEEAINTLIKVGSQNNENKIVLETCGESLGQIWVRANTFSENSFNKLTRAAKAGVFFVIENKKPDWLKQYNIKINNY